MPKFLVVLMLTLGARTTVTPQELSHIQFTVRDGLPGSVVYQCLQDRSGFMWFCTDQGVSCFDGRTFRNFFKNDGLPDNEVLKLYLDTYGNVWFISLKGIPSVFYKGSILRADACKGVYAITEDHRSGCIILLSSYVEGSSTWVGYYKSPNTPGHWRWSSSMTTIDKELNGKGIPLLRASSEKEINFYFAYTHPGMYDLGIEGPGGTIWHSFPYSLHLCYLPYDRISFCSLAPDQRSILFFTDTLYLADSAHLQRVLTLSELRLERSDLTDIYCENDSTLWLCSRNRGLILVRNFRRPAARMIRSYFPETFCTSIRKDREGGYWLTTHDDGVYYLPDLDVRYVTGGGQLVGKDIKCIRAIDDHTLVAGLSNGRIVFFNSNGAGVRSFIPWGSGNKNNRLLDIKPLGRSQFVVANDRGLDLFSPGTGSRRMDFNKSVKGVCCLRDSGIVFAAAEGLYRFRGYRDTIDALTRKRATCVEGIGNTYYWGTLDGLYSSDGKKVCYLGDETPALAGIINHIDIAADSTVWVSTQQGVVVLRRGRSFSIGTAQGLSSDMCKNVSIAGPVAWVSTNKGVSRIFLRWEGTQPVYTVSHITESDGLMFNDVNQTALAAGYVWAATARGISFFPMDYVPHSMQKPLIHINTPDVVDLDYRHNKLIIGLSGISFRSAKQITYQYRLRDLDSNWISTSNNRLEFSTLPYGVHTFEARVADRWGALSSEVKRITILVSPPFWRTLWFTMLIYLLVLLLMAGGIYAYFRWRHDKKDRAFKLRSKMADLEMMALRAQMNPHFIFNCLSSIQSYILVADVRNANLYLHKLSVLIRKILQHSPRPYSTLTEELTELGLYMELEKLRLADRMDYSIDVARDLHPEDILIPSLILQPFAENAIQHGISPLRDRKGVVRINFRRSGRYLVCTIEDNGVGIHASRREKPQVEHTSMGLGIISHRVRIINAIRKEAVSIKITDKSENGPHEPGTIAQIYFPI